MDLLGHGDKHKGPPPVRSRIIVVIHDHHVRFTPTRLRQADRFVSWSLVTIGACLVLGVLVKFNAMGGVCFLASVVASQPFWVPGAQATYNQWVEIAALLAIASLPTGGWSGLDFFLGKWLGNLCPLTGCCRTESRD